MFKKLSMIVALVMSFSIISGFSANSASAAYNKYENVTLTNNEQVAFTDPISVTSGTIDYYVKNNTGASAIPRILSWSITDLNGNAVAEGSINPLDANQSSDLINSGTIYVPNGNYRLNLSGYVNVDGYGSIYGG